MFEGEADVLTSKKLMTVFSALALSLGLATPSFAGDETAFTRFKTGGKEGSGALQIAQATYRNPKTGVDIVLYGVVHIADKAYYKAVDKELGTYDAVLWEGVKPGKKKVKPDESMAGIGEMQKIMCELLDLTFQKDGINYKGRNNFVWADMNMDQLQEAFGDDAQKGLGGMMSPGMMKQLGPLLKMGAPLIKFLLKSNPTMRSKMKLQFAQQLANAGNGGQMPGMGEKFQEVILIKRNEVVMKFLKKQLKITKKGSIAIFYGAAHMPDFHERLAKMGYTQVKKEWKDAWQVGAGASSSDEKSPAPAPKSTPRPKTSKKRWF
jgi:hypothetical protein